MVERDIGNSQRGARADDRQRAGIALRIGRQHHRDHLRLIHVAFRKQRPDRPVDKPAGQNFFLRGPSLAFNEAARKLAGGVSVFTVIHRERKEGGVRLGLFVGAGAYQHHGISRTNHHGPIGLLGYLSCFNCDFLTIQVNFYGM